MAQAGTLRREIMKYYTIRRFDGGLNNLANASLADNQASEILNFDLATRGSIKVRLGHTRLNASALADLSAGAFIGSSAPIRGLTRFYNTSGSNQWVACCSGRVHYGASILSAYLTQTMTVDADMEFTVFKDTLLMVNGVNKFKSKLRGAGDCSAWTNAPAMIVLKPWQDRLWGVPTASAYVVKHTSAAGSVDGWTTSHYFTVGRQDGGDIIALEILFGNLVILKTTGIYTLTGTHPQNYQLDRMSKHGCISRRSVVVGDNGIIYLASDGVRIFDGMQSVLLSENENYWVDILGAINMSKVNNVAATYFDRKYILAYDDVAAGVIRNNYAFVYNFLTGTWTKYSHPGNVFFKTLGSNEALDLYFGSSVSGYIYKMFNGYTDDNPAATAAARTTSAAAISASYKTKAFDFSDKYTDLALTDKQFRKVLVEGSIASSYVGVSAEIDSGRGITKNWNVRSEAVATFTLGVSVLGVDRLGAGLAILDSEQSLPVGAQGKTISLSFGSQRRSQQAEINAAKIGWRKKRVRG